MDMAREDQEQWCILCKQTVWQRAPNFSIQNDHKTLARHLSTEMLVESVREEHFRMWKLSPSIRRVMTQYF